MSVAAVAGMREPGHGASCTMSRPGCECGADVCPGRVVTSSIRTCSFSRRVRYVPSIQLGCVHGGVACRWDRRLQLHRDRPRAFDEPLLHVNHAPSIEQHVSARDRLSDRGSPVRQSGPSLARGEEVCRRIPDMLVHRRSNVLRELRIPRPDVIVLEDLCHALTRERRWITLRSRSADNNDGDERSRECDLLSRHCNLPAVRASDVDDRQSGTERDAQAWRAK